MMGHVLDGPKVRRVASGAALALVASVVVFPLGSSVRAGQPCGSMAEMTVRKEVVNPAGDPDATTNFTFTPDPTAPWLLPNEQTQGFFQLVHDTERQTCTDSTTQDYTVTETTDPLYNTTSSCTGDIDPQNRVSSASGSSVTFRPGPTQGEVLVCTFTNTRKTGTLRVQKALVPTSDPGKFDLQIDGVTRRADAGHGDGVNRTVETGSHSVGELAAPGTNLGDYKSGIQCLNAQGGLVKSGTGTSLSNIPVGEGDQIACTITNTRATADLALTKTDPPGRVPTGRNMTYTLTVTNNGPDAASGVTVTDQLPPSVTYVSATPSQGSCGEAGGVVTCDLGDMGSGAIATVDIVVKPTAAGTITNTASVTAATPDPDEGNNSDSENTSVCRITSRRSSIPCG